MTGFDLLILGAIMLVVFQVKHFFVDFIVQTLWRPDAMDKFLRVGWVKPLIIHSIDQAIGTMMAILVSIMMFSVIAGSALFLPVLPYLVLGAMVFDFVIHFTADRIKASPDMLGKYNPDQDEFWIALGWDQMMHHFTHYVIIGVSLYVFFNFGVIV